MTNLPITGIFNVTCEYGRKGKWACGHHTGIDLICDNDKIYSSCDGTVVRTGYDKSYGNFIVVKNNTDNTFHWFCHLSKILVKNGNVNRKTIIGIMGSTGNSTGKHLHFEIRKASNKYGDDINPCYWLGIENKVQYGLNSNNYQMNNDAKTLNVGDVKKLGIKTNIREYPNLTGKPHLFLPKTTVKILETNVNNEDGFIWDKVQVVYAGANDFKVGYIARTCQRYQ